MLAALLTTAFFSFSIIFAQRSLTAAGQMRANLGRLVVAVVVLGLYAHTIGTGLSSVSTGWLVISGAVGMGLGDLALFLALPRLGSRLTLLVVQCLAAPIATICEWLWLGTTMAATQIAMGGVVLTGVAVAFLPDCKHPVRVKLHWSGFVLGFLAAAGQGIGAIITRKGSLLAFAASEGQIDGINAAYHRILGAIVLTVLWFVLLRGRKWGRSLFHRPTQSALRLGARQWTRWSRDRRELLPMGTRHHS